MSESRSEPGVEPVREGRNRWMESKKGRIEGLPGARGHEAPLREACLSEKGNPMTIETMLRCHYPE